jgi:MGT family glycosyltransferase
MDLSNQPVNRDHGGCHQANRILFTPASNILAHVGRCVVLARELKNRGYHVTLAGTPKFLQDPAVVPEAEFETYPIPDYEAEEGLEILRKVRKVPSKKFLNEHIQAELQMLDRVRPDVVVNDFRLTLYISARLRNIPVISLVGGRYMYQYAAKPFKAPRTHPTYPVLKRIMGEKGTDAVVPRLQRWALRYKMWPFYRLSKQYGLEPKKDLWDLLVGEYNLILDTELLGPTKPLPENFRRVGPIAWNPQIPLPEWITTLDRTKPVIYITMGSTGHPDLFKKMIEVLAHADYTVIMSTGGQLHIPEASLPKNFRVAKFVPGEQIMELADLVVFHGGAGTGYQAIGTGTPAIAIATHLEQEFVGQVLEEHGAGLFLTMNQVLASPTLIRTAIATMLERIDLYRVNMRWLREDLLNYNPVRTAADCIEGFIISSGQRSAVSFQL